MSVGVKGLRLGVGPRGTYVRVSPGKLIYAAAFPKSRNRSRSLTSSGQVLADNKTSEYQEDTGHDSFVEIESASVAEMQPSSAKDLLDEISSRSSKVKIWPLTLLAAVFAAPFAPEFTILAIGALPICVWIDGRRRRVVVLYDLDDRMEKVFKFFCEAFDLLSSAKRVQHIEAKANITDKKRHAGADHLVQAKDVSLRYALPSMFKTNISVPTIPVGKQLLAFFPDRLLVIHGKKVGAVEYRELKLKVYSSHMIEHGKVPKDAIVVDHTWQYTNKKGGPDKRFKDNKKLPITLCENLRFSSESGLDELIQLSFVGRGDGFKEVLGALEKLLRTS